MICLVNNSKPNNPEQFLMNSSAKQTSEGRYDELPYLSSSGPPLGPRRNMHFTREKMIRCHTEERKKYPFSQDCLGHRNPYNNTIINFDFEYYEYLREHTYYMFCDEELQTAKARAKEDAANTYKDEIALADSTIKTLKQELSSSAAKHTRTRRWLLLAVAVLLVFSVLAGAGVISFGSRTPSRTYEQGYAEGQADQKAADAGLYDEGYAAGQEDGNASGYRSGYAEGKDDGYNDGYYKGYWEGYADAGERSSGSGDSSGSRSGTHTGTGSTRDTPVADTYIGNKSSKKFHLPSCSYLPDQNNQVTFDSREDALAAGYSPCGHCHP